MKTSCLDLLPFFLRSGFAPLVILAAAVSFSTPAESGQPAVTAIKIEGGLKSLSSLQGNLFVETMSGKTLVIGQTNGQFQLTPKTRPPSASQARPKDILPDGEVTSGNRNIRRAWLGSPTKRYGHAVLGDAVEAGSVVAELANGKIATFTLGEDAVFEDRYPRLVDIDGDGADEILLVKSYLNRGAAAVVISPAGSKLEKRAESAAIGLAHRWLNPVGVADFDGDGVNEIAVVITPHIGGTLQLYEMKGNTLNEDISAHGFSNHQMGSRNLGLSAIGDFNKDGTPDIALPDASRRNILGATFVGGMFRELFRVPLTGPITTAIHAHDIDGDGQPEIIFGLAPDRLVVFSPAP